VTGATHHGVHAVKFEYLVLEQQLFQSGPIGVERELNRLGEDGWELVAAAGLYSQSLILKRPVQMRKPRSKTETA
jgi:hypothetical protein